MQSPDEPNFYLKHGFDKEYTDYGCPYLQENCDAQKPSDNLVIYGHNMKNNSMFGDLDRLCSKEFWEAHRTISFHTLREKRVYEIIAVLNVSVHTGTDWDFPYYLFTDAESADDFAEYVAQCKARALYDTGVTAQYGDKLLTLSTCEYSHKNGRLLVVAKQILTNEQP